MKSPKLHQSRVPFGEPLSLGDDLYLRSFRIFTSSQLILHPIRSFRMALPHNPGWRSTTAAEPGASRRHTYIGVSLTVWLNLSSRLSVYRLLLMPGQHPRANNERLAPLVWHLGRTLQLLRKMACKKRDRREASCQATRGEEPPVDAQPNNSTLRPRGVF